MHKSRAALFIDFDNIQIKASKIGLNHCEESQLWTTPIIKEIEESIQGSVDIRKCYGNVLLNTGSLYRNNIFKGKEIRALIEADKKLQMDLIRNGFQMIHTPDFSGKNRADILMALDCIEIALKHEQVDTFAILTEDSDFTPLFDKLRAAGKRVILVTVSESEKNSRSRQTLLSLVNKHIVYDQGVIDKYGYDILYKTLASQEEEEPHVLKEGINLSSLSSRMIQQYDFKSENLGYSNFKSFVEDCLTEKYELVGNIVKTKKAFKDEIPKNSKLVNIQAALKKQGIKIDYALMLKAKNFISDKSDAWGKAINYGDLQVYLCDRFVSDGYSKIQVKEAIKLLLYSGFIILIDSDEIPMKQRKCRFTSEIDLSGSFSFFIIDRIHQAGFSITEAEVGEVTQFIFGNKDSKKMKVMKESIALLTFPKEE